jgi:hypothetical protein
MGVRVDGGGASNQAWMERMDQAVRRLLVALALALAFALALPSGAGAQEFKEIALTEKKVEGFIAAQKDLAALTQKSPPRPGEKPDQKVIEELEAIAKRHGFANFNEYGEVAANIGIIMAGLDPETKSFSEPPAVVKEQIEEVMADRSIPAREKGQILEELKEALKQAQPIKQRANIELVKKFYDRLDAVMQ